MRRVLVWLALLVAGCSTSPGQNILPVNGDSIASDDTPGGGDGLDGDVYTEPDMGPPFGGIMGWKVINVSKPTTSWTDLSGARLENDQYQVFAVGGLGEVVVYSSITDEWEDISLSSSVPLTGVWGLSDDYLFVVGENGVLRRHVDEAGTGQAVWKADEYALGLGVDMNGVHGVSKTNVWAVGNNRTILRWNGSSWYQFQDSDYGFTDKPDFNNVLVVSDTDAIVAGNGVLARFMGGKIVKFDQSVLATANISGLDLDATGAYVWVGADKGLTFRVTLATSYLYQMPEPTTYSAFRSMFVTPANQVYAGGDNLPLVLWFTQDAAAPAPTWAPVIIESPDAINTTYPDRITTQARIVGIWGTGDQNLYVATREKKILQYALHE